MRALITLVAAGLLTGCALKPGRHVIVGFGIVDVAPAGKTTAVKTTAVGFSASGRNMAIGLSKTSEVSISDTTTNLVLEIK
jgi:hypothetical protein